MLLYKAQFVALQDCCVLLSQSLNRHAIKNIVYGYAGKYYCCCRHPVENATVCLVWITVNHFHCLIHTCFTCGVVTLLLSFNQEIVFYHLNKR